MQNNISWLEFYYRGVFKISIYRLLYNHTNYSLTIEKENNKIHESTHYDLNDLFDDLESFYDHPE